MKDLKGVERVGAGGGLPVGTGVNIGYHTVGHQPYAAWVFRQLYDADGNPVYNAFADLNGDNQSRIHAEKGAPPHSQSQESQFDLMVYHYKLLGNRRLLRQATTLNLWLSFH